MLASSLREMRISAGLRQDDIAVALKITKATVSRMENGHQGTTVEQAQCWAQACGFTLTFMGPEHEHLAREVATLSPEDANLARRLVAALPKLHTLRKADLDNLLSGWLRVSGSSDVEIVKKTSSR